MRPTELSCFVVVGPGQWAKFDTLHEAVASVKARTKRGRGKQEPQPLEVFASDGPLSVSTDWRVHVHAEPGKALVHFIINA